MIGSNQQLQEDITISTEVYNSTTEEPTRSILHTDITVANHLVQDRALLLPAVSKLFISSYSFDYFLSSPVVDINLELGEYTIKFSLKWLLNQLILHFHSNLDYKCVLKNECQNLPIEKPDDGDDNDEDEDDDNTNSDSEEDSDNEGDENKDDDIETEIITNMDYKQSYT